MNKNKLIPALLLACVTQVQALQIHTATEDESVEAQVSATETSRITLVGDRIKQFFINQGRLVIEKDEAKGDLYITPAQSFQDKPINLFITSEQGKTFSLLLTPADISSATVVVKSAASGHHNSKACESTSPYEASITQLIKAMALGEVPKGYQVVGARDSVLEIEENLKIEIITQFVGPSLQGQVLEVTNDSKEPLTLTVEDFEALNALAIAIEESNLAPEASTRILVVTRHG